MDLTRLILSSGFGAGIMAIILAVMQRHWAKNDKQDAIVEALKVLMVDRVHYVGQSYIYAGQITLDSKENLKEMYEAYKKLGGNGHLNTIMAEIENLKIVGKETGKEVSK